MDFGSKESVKRGIKLKKIIGVGLIIISIILCLSMIIIVKKRNIYGGDVLDFILDAWDVIGIFIVIIIIGIIMIKGL